MNPSLAPLLVGMTVVIAVIAVYQVVSDVFLRDRSRTNDRVDQEFLRKRTEQAKRSPLFKNLGAMAAEASSGLEGRPTIKQKFESMVEQSGMDTTPGWVLGTAGVAALIVGLAALLVRLNPIDGLVAGALAGFMPILRVKRRRNARLEKLRSQLPEAFDLMARVVRAGQTLGQALLAVADEFPQPISSEFAYCYEQQNLGLSPEVTFRDLNRRTGIIELKIFVMAVIVQQQSGGNLAELLSKLAAVVRERYLIRGTISSLTAEGRMQGWILAGLPPLMLGLLMFLNFNYACVLFQHPNLILGTAGFEMLGVLWIRKIVNFDF